MKSANGTISIPQQSLEAKHCLTCPVRYDSEDVRSTGSMTGIINVKVRAAWIPEVWDPAVEAVSRPPTP